MEKLPEEWAPQLHDSVTTNQSGSTFATWEPSPSQPAQTFRSEQAHWDVELSCYTNTAFFEDQDAYHAGNTGAAQAMNEAEQHKLDG